LGYVGFASEKWQTEEKYPVLKNQVGNFMQDPITDMFNRIKNAQAVFHQTVEIPFSNLKYELAKILEKERFIENAAKKGKASQKIIRINLKYQKKGLGNVEEKRMEPAILGIKRISKLGQRIYIKKKNIKKVRGGYGIAIISTPKGLVTDKEARKQKLGGEIICEIW